MKSRSLHLAVVLLLVAATAAVASATLASFDTYDLDRDLYLLTGSAQGGTEPFAYEWSIDGGAFAARTQRIGVFCQTVQTAAFRVVDADGRVSNFESFACP